MRAMEVLTDKRVREVYELLKQYGKTPAGWIEEKYGKDVIDRLREMGLASVMFERGILYVIPDVNEKLAYTLLYKIWHHMYAYMPRRKLTKEELALLPILRQYDFINYDNDAVWLTVHGYAYICDLEKLYPELTKELEFTAYVEMNNGKVKTMDELEHDFGTKESAQEFLKWCQEHNTCKMIKLNTWKIMTPK